MKLLILALAVVFVCLLLFLAGVFSPGKSRRWQNGVDGLSKKAEKKGFQKAGSLGDMTGKAFKKSRHAADRSADMGRHVHEEIPPD